MVKNRFTVKVVSSACSSGMMHTMQHTPAGGHACLNARTCVLAYDGLGTHWE